MQLTMKTRKQVLADFYGMQRQLFAEGLFQGVDIRAYNDGEYWNVTLCVSHYDDVANELDLWERVEWTHYSHHDEEDEGNNLARVAEFKAKFNLK